MNKWIVNGIIVAVTGLLSAWFSRVITDTPIDEAASLEAYALGILLSVIFASVSTWIVVLLCPFLLEHARRVNLWQRLRQKVAGILRQYTDFMGRHILDKRPGIIGFVGGIMSMTIDGLLNLQGIFVVTFTMILFLSLLPYELRHPRNGHNGNANGNSPA